MARNKYDVDEIIEEQFDVHQLLRLGKYVAPHKKKMFLAAVLMLSSSALTMLIPIFFMRVILAADPVFSGHSEGEDPDHQPGGSECDPSAQDGSVRASPGAAVFLL